MKNYLLIILSALLFACKQQIEQVPTHIVSQQKMIGVTVDLKIIESAINLNHYNRVTDKNSIDSLYKSVYNKYNLTKADIDTSLVYYTSKPELMLEIYDSALVAINKLNL